MVNVPLSLIESGVHRSVDGEVRRHYTAVAVPSGIRRCAALQGPHAVAVTEVGQRTFQAAAMLVVWGKTAALGNGQGRTQVGNSLTIVADGKLNKLPILFHPNQDFSHFDDCQGACNCVVQQLKNGLGRGSVVSANGGKQGGAAGGVVQGGIRQTGVSRGKNIFHCSFSSYSDSISVTKNSRLCRGLRLYGLHTRQNVGVALHRAFLLSLGSKTACRLSPTRCRRPKRREVPDEAPSEVFIAVLSCQARANRVYWS